MKTLQTVCSAPRKDAPLGRILFADKVIVLSRHTEQRLLEGGIAAARLARIPPAVSPLAAPDSALRAQARESFGLAAPGPLVLYPGDLEFSGGAERALRMHAALRGQDTWLAMACRAKTPGAREAEARLRALTTELGTSSRVRFVGETPGIHRLLAAADVVVLPAEDLFAKMDLPLVLIEAMLLERAVVVLAGTAAAELCEDGSAIAVDADRDALVSSVQELLEDTAAREALGARARVRALEAYGPVAVARAHESLYDELLS